jgi:hypothetical protein
VTVATDATWTPDRAFCRFDGRRVAADAFGVGTASCLVPGDLSGSVRVEFSLDGDIWVGKKRLRLPFNISIPAVVMFALALVGSGSAMIYKVWTEGSLCPSEAQL